MFKKIKAGLNKLILNLKNSVKRFPETLVISTAVVVIAIIINHIGNNDAEETLTRILMSLALGLPIFSSLKLLYERFNLGLKIRIASNVIVSILIYVYYLMLPEEFDSAFMFRYIVLNVSLYLAFTLIPYFIQRKKYSIYILALITKFAITYLYSFVLYLGMNAIIFTIDKLFLLNIDSKVYLDLFFIVAGIFAITYFLGSIPTYREEMEEKNYPRVIHMLLTYIVLPLIAIYTGIIYVYFAKILITWQWPMGIVGRLVLWYGMISTIVLFFVYTLRDKNIFIKKFFKYFPIIILLPIAMMYLAVGIRVNIYGITVLRYLVLIAGIWIVGNMLYFRLSKNVKTTIVVASAIIVLLISAYGPLNAYSVSIGNQNNRFEALLTEYGMLEDNQIKASKDLSESQKEEISEYIRYFNSYHNLSDVKVLPKGFELKDMEEVFGFKYIEKDYWEDERRHMRYYFDKNAVLLDISDYDYLIDLRFYEDIDISIEDKDIQINYLENSEDLEIIRQDEVIYTININDLANRYDEIHQGYNPENIQDIVITDQNEDILVSFVILELYGEQDEDSDRIVQKSMQVRMLVKLVG